MRKLLGILAVAALALPTTQADAASLPFSGSLSLSLAGLPPLVAPGAGTVTATLTGNHISPLSVAVSAFKATAVRIPITDPLAAPIKGIQATFHNGPGAFAGSTLAGSMPVLGVTKVCLFSACSNAVANLSVPLDVVGAGGAVTVTGNISVTVVGAPWTAGTAAVGTVTEMGFQHGPVSGTSSTAANNGALRLVTPIFVSTNIPSSAIVPGFGFLDLHFVPEPGTLLLLGSGMAGLVLLGRSKRS